MNHPTAAPEAHPGFAPASTLMVRLRGVDSVAAEAFERIFADEHIGSASDRDVLEALSLAAQLQRRLEGLMVELVGEADARSANRPNAGGIAASVGCRNVNGLVQSVTLASPQTVAVSLRVARKLRRGGRSWQQCVCRAALTARCSRSPIAREAARLPSRPGWC